MINEIVPKVIDDIKKDKLLDDDFGRIVTKQHDTIYKVFSLNKGNPLYSHILNEDNRIRLPLPEYPNMEFEVVLMLAWNAITDGKYTNSESISDKKNRETYFLKITKIDYSRNHHLHLVDAISRDDLFFRFHLTNPLSVSIGDCITITAKLTSQNPTNGTPILLNSAIIIKNYGKKVK